MGTNNPTQPAHVKADIAASVAALAPGNERSLAQDVTDAQDDVAPSSLRVDEST